MMNEVVFNTKLQMKRRRTAGACSCSLKALTSIIQASQFFLNLINLIEKSINIYDIKGVSYENIFYDKSKKKVYITLSTIYNGLLHLLNYKIGFFYSLNFSKLIK